MCRAAVMTGRGVAGIAIVRPVGERGQTVERREQRGSEKTVEGVVRWVTAGEGRREERLLGDARGLRVTRFAGGWLGGGRLAVDFAKYRF